MSVNMSVSWNSAGPPNYSRGDRGRAETDPRRLGAARLVNVFAGSQPRLAIRRDSVQITTPERDVKACSARR